ncbi:MAG: LytR C-terminal domain-containing protein [Angustibacter sp.]
MSTGFSERRGAHRPAGQGPTSAIPWLVAAVAIVAIVLFASGWFGGSSAPASSTVKAGPSPSSGKTAQGSSTTKASTGASPSSPAPTADRTLSVSVLNSTSTSGLAAKGAARLKTAGWSIRSTGNYRGAVSGTTVFYGRASLRATAQAVAADLGTSAVSESADFGSSRVTVVLGADFRP